MSRWRSDRGAHLDQIEDVYRRDLDRFLRVAAALVGDRELARDAVQEGFATAVRKRGSFAGRGSLESWLWQVVINRARNFRRDVGASRGHDLESDFSDEVTVGNGDVADGRLRAAIAALPERQRLLIFLHYYADLDYETIADALGIRSGTVGATLTAARSALRQTLKEPAND
jgi:RNA polymerase sigma-70 factor, ECF subfamily